MIIPTMVRRGFAKLFDVRAVTFGGQQHLSPYSRWHEPELDTNPRPIRALCLKEIPEDAEFRESRIDEHECQECRLLAMKQGKVQLEGLWDKDKGAWDE